MVSTIFWCIYIIISIYIYICMCLYMYIHFPLFYIRRTYIVSTHPSFLKLEGGDPSRVSKDSNLKHCPWKSMVGRRNVLLGWIIFRGVCWFQGVYLDNGWTSVFVFFPPFCWKLVLEVRWETAKNYTPRRLKKGKALQTHQHHSFQILLRNKTDPSH